MSWRSSRRFFGVRASPSSLGEKASPKERTKEDEHLLKLDAGAGMEGAGSPLLPKEFLQPERSIQGLIELKDKLRNAPDMHPAGKLSA